MSRRDNRRKLTIYGKRGEVEKGGSEVDGRKMYVFAEKVCKVMDKAIETGCFIIGLNVSASARI